MNRSDTAATGVPAAFPESEYYSRQVRLPEVGVEGQQRLQDGRVLVIGSGGLGSPALAYLAAAGVGTLGICEADKLEASNLHRQILYGHAQVGQPKARLAAERLREQNPFIQVVCHEQGLTPENVVELFGQYDLVLDCTDNFPTKFMINDAAVLTGTPAVFASIYQYEGQLMAVHPGQSACLRCLWPEMPDPGCVGSCAEVGVLGAVPGIFGTIQAMEALKFFLELQPLLHNRMIIFDCLGLTTQSVAMPRHPQCPVCGTAPSIQTIERTRYWPQDDLTVDIALWREADFARYRVIDIREDNEVAAQPLEGVAHEHLPMSQWAVRAQHIDKTERLLLCCARGMRSKRLAEQLREQGFTHVLSVNEGWQAFHRRAQAPWEQ